MFFWEEVYSTFVKKAAEIISAAFLSLENEIIWNFLVQRLIVLYLQIDIRFMNKPICPHLQNTHAASFT